MQIEDNCEPLHFFLNEHHHHEYYYKYYCEYYRHVLPHIARTWVPFCRLASILSVSYYGEAAQAKLPVSPGIPPDGQSCSWGRGSVFMAVRVKHSYEELCPLAIRDSNTANSDSLSCLPQQGCWTGFCQSRHHTQLSAKMTLCIASQPHALKALV